MTVGYFVFAVLTAILGYVIGVRKGRKDASNAPALGEAWQKGYDTASDYWKSHFVGPLGASQPDAGLQPEGQTAAAGPGRAAQQQPFGPPAAPETAAPRTLGDATSGRPAASDAVPASSQEALPQTVTPHAATARASMPPSPAPAAPKTGLPFMPGATDAATQAAAPAQGHRGPTPSAQPKPTLTPRERELRNINITLYVASLLLVAAGALFLSFALAPVAKLVGLCLVAASFYAAGLIVHKVRQTLRPAAAAFTGTGLALLPLCAIATYTTLQIPGSTVWFIFSLLGTLAFGYATIRLRSRVLAWLAVLILISTAASSGALLQQGVLAYLVALLALSVAFQLLTVRSQAVRDSPFNAAINTSIQLLPPLVFLAAWVMLGELRDRDYFWIFLLLSAHYLIATRLRANWRGVHFAAARFLFVLALGVGMAYLEVEPTPALTVLLLVLVAQAALVTIYEPAYRGGFAVGSQWVGIEKAVLWGLSLVLLAALYEVADRDGGTSWWLTLILVPLLLIGLTWLTRQGGNLEPVVILAVTGATLLEDEQHWWLPLPALTLAALGLSLVCRKPPLLLARSTAELRWLLLLAIGAKLGQSLHMLLGGAERHLALSGIVGVWAVTVLLLARNALRAVVAPRSAVARYFTLGRLIASFLLLVALAAVTRAPGAALGEGTTFLGFGVVAWSAVLLLGAVLVIILTGVRTDSGTEGQVAASAGGAVLAALVLLFALSFRDDLWWLVPVVALLNLGYLFHALRQSVGRRWRIAHAALAQLHFTVAIWWTVDHFALDLHGQFSVLILSVLLPQGVRLAHASRRNRPLRSELEVITLGLLAALPLLLAFYGASPREADRGTVLLGLCAWIGYALLAHSALSRSSYRQWLLLPVVVGAVGLAMVPAAAMNPGTGWIRQPLWAEGTALWLLAGLVLVAGITEYVWRTNGSHRAIRLVALVLPLVTMLGYQDSRGWVAFALLLAAGASGLLVHTRRLAWCALSAAGFGMVASYTGWRAVSPTGPLVEGSLDLSWSMLGAALVLLVVALLHGRFTDPQPGYPDRLAATPQSVGQASRLYYASMLGAGLVAGLNAHLLHTRALPVLGGAGLLLLVLLVARVHELPAAWAHHGTDALISVGALLGLRSYAVLLHEPPASGALLYLAVVAAGIGVRHLRARAVPSRYWLMGAAALASAGELASVADAGALTQMLVLVFFAALLAFAVLRGEKLFTWWAAVAITAAVLWFLRNYVFLLLVLLAAGLILLAIMKLVKVERNPK